MLDDAASSGSTRPGGDLTGAIRSAIVDGRFAPGQRLIEPDLCVLFGASRAAVRLALFELAADGLVERTLNRGSRVRSIDIDEAVEILEVRTGLEALCAAKAAERITEPDREDLRRLREELTDAVDRGDLLRYSQVNQRLDDTIRAISGHHTAGELLLRLRAQVVRQQYRLAYQPGRAAVSGPQHVAIIDAILAGDAAEAERATREHLSSVVDAMRAVSGSDALPGSTFPAR
jgi:DNA-binding GntR family transcriptional regulator